MEDNKALKKLHNLTPQLKNDEIAANYLRELLKHYNKTQDFNIIEQGMQLIIQARNEETIQ